MNWRIAALVLLLVGGCMRTRHIDVCHCSTCGPDAATADTVYNERCWLGFWPACPSRVQP
jgi:hypothetical protein